MSSTSGGGETAEAATGLFGLALGGSSDEDSADEAPEKLAYDAAAATYVPKQCEPLVGVSRHPVSPPPPPPSLSTHHCLPPPSTKTISRLFHALRSPQN